MGGCGIRLWVIVIAFFFSASGSWAQGTNDNVQQEVPVDAQAWSGMKEKGMEQKMGGQIRGFVQADSGQGGCPMKDKMMHRKAGAEMVASSDGGVIILQGRKLSKYDKNLNLVKEVELKMDMAGMHMKKGEKTCGCPHCQMMKQEAEKHGDDKPEAAKGQ